MQVNVFSARIGRIILLLALLGVLTVMPLAALAQNSAEASAATAGFGAAFGYAASIGPVAYSSTGSIGTGWADATAWGPGMIMAGSGVATSGPAASFAGSLASPFGAMAQVLTSAMWGGNAFGWAWADN